jgi:hypothetical protein
MAEPSDTTTADAQPANGLSDHEVREAAYYLWEQEGRPDGRHLAHYYQAEARLRERRSPGPSMMPRVEGKTAGVTEHTNGSSPKPSRRRGRP